MLLPTKLGLSLIAGVFALYLVSLQSRSGLLFLVMGILLACFVMNALSARWAAKCLVIEPPAAISCVEGEALKDAWTVRNPSSMSAGMAEVALPPFGTLFRVGAIPSRDAAHLTPVLPMPQRGAFPFQTLQVRSAYPYGLFCFHRALRHPGEILVVPRVYPCPSPPAAGFEPMVGGTYKGQNRSSSGDQFHGVRPLQSGDPVKLIHWGSSAKGQGIMVREFDEELSGRVTIVVDCMPGAAPGNEPYLNWVSRCSASLMLAALDAGHQVEFAILGQPDLLLVPPFADGQVVLTALARATLDPHSLSRENLDDVYHRAPRKSALCYVLSQVNDAFRGHLRATVVADRRRASLYLPDTRRQDAADLESLLPVQAFTADSLEG